MEKWNRQEREKREERRKKNWNIAYRGGEEGRQGVGHGDIGFVGGKFVLLAERLELAATEGVIIHCDRRSELHDSSYHHAIEKPESQQHGMQWWRRRTGPKTMKMKKKKKGCR